MTKKATKPMKAFVLCGVPGAGKTTYAEKLSKLENATIVSGDNIRKELYGSWEIVGNWGEIWGAIDDAVADAVGGNVIIDGTHCRPEYRAEITTLLRSYGYDNIEALVIDVSLATALARNFQRERNVPDYAVTAMHEEFQRSVDGIINEPFDKVTYLHRL